MGIHIAKDTALSDSIKANYHRIVEFTFNSITGRCVVVIASYITEADEEDGKAPYSHASYTLTTVNPLQQITVENVGVPLMGIVQSMLEAAIVAEIPEFSGATIG